MTLSGLINQWENHARRSFWNAEKAKDSFGKRFFEHRAVVYFNCIRELREALKQLPPEFLTKQEGDQK
jgi:hypothetical protein